MSTLCRLHDRVPVDFGLFNHGSERVAARTHLKYLSKNDVVVYDRGYWSYAFLHAHQRKGIHTVFRIKEKANPTFDACLASRVKDCIIDLEPPKIMPTECEGTWYRPLVSSLCLRRYRIPIGNHPS